MGDSDGTQTSPYKPEHEHAMVDEANILVVDDQEANRFLLQQLIESLGYEANLASSGMEALDMVEDRQPDLLLLDLMMPEMTGDQVLAELKANPAHRHIPIIVISAIDDASRVVSCIENGAMDYLVKPFNTTLLRARIRASLAMKRHHDNESRYLQEIEAANAQINRQNKTLLKTNRQLEREIEKRMGIEGDSRTAQKMALRNAHAAGMAEIANAVLHNIGNTLNSVNTSCYRIQRILENSHLNNLNKANVLLQQSALAASNHRPDAALLEYYTFLQEAHVRENEELDEEVASLVEKVQVIKAFIMKQRNLSEGAVFKEKVNVNRVVREVLQMQKETLHADRIQTRIHLHEVPVLMAQKAKLSYIVLSLVINSRESMEDHPRKDHLLTLETGLDSEKRLYIRVSDTGCGIENEEDTDIFASHYVSAARDRGFDLHNTAIAVTEMGGRIEARSPGLNRGTVMTLTFPLEKEPPPLLAGALSQDTRST